MANDLQGAADRLRHLGPGTSPPEEARISPSLVTVLECVVGIPGCGIQALANELDLSTPSVSISVRQLEKAGFLERQPDPDDGRAVQIFLTIEGQELHKRIHNFRRKKFELLLAGLRCEERNTMLDLLECAISTAENK